MWLQLTTYILKSTIPILCHQRTKNTLILNTTILIPSYDPKAKFQSKFQVLHLPGGSDSENLNPDGIKMSWPPLVQKPNLFISAQKINNSEQPVWPVERFSLGWLVVGKLQSLSPDLSGYWSAKEECGEGYKWTKPQKSRNKIQLLLGCLKCWSFWDHQPIQL